MQIYIIRVCIFGVIMKKYIVFILFIPIVIISVYFAFKFHRQDNYIKSYSQFKTQILLKGLTGAQDITTDEAGNIYIAYKDKIELVKNNGKSTYLIKDKNYEIYSLVYNKGELYFASKHEIIDYSVKNHTLKVLLDNIPNYGDYKETRLMISSNDLYIAIGAATNSGVAGGDNKWLKENPFGCDIPAKDIKLKGSNFNENKTGAFVPYGTKNVKDQIITGHFPGNASLIKLTLTNNNIETFAWGLRNIKGMDVNSDGKIFAAVGGFEDRGLRPVKGDYDYIYEIKEDKWYGWPDYSGGDPINSPRFSSGGKSKLDFILENPPSANPPAPFYQHKSCSTITAMVIDSSGTLGEKDSIYFYDSRDNILYELNKSGILTEEIHSLSLCKVTSLNIFKNNLLLFDKEHGCIYNAYKGSNNAKFYNSKDIYFVLLVIILSLVLMLAVLLAKSYRKLKNK